MKKLFAALTGVALLSVMAVSSPASADKKGEPAESGVVLRFDPTQGGHGVGPVTADVNGEDRRLVAIFGFADSLTFCNDGPPVENGVEQVALPPSGGYHVVVHNSDIPVLVFDVTDVLTEEDFFAGCAAGDIVPLATGTAKQRPIINGDDSGQTVKIKSMGVVTDALDRDWKLQSFFKETGVFGDGPPVFEVQNAWIKLTLL